MLLSVALLVILKNSRYCKGFKQMKSWLVAVVLALFPINAVANQPEVGAQTANSPQAPMVVDDGTLLDKSGDSKNIRNLKPYMDDKNITIGTGSFSGTYYPVGNVICKLLNRDRKSLGIRCAAENNNGSLDNLKGLANAQYDFAMAQSDWQEIAYNGVGEFKDKRIDKLRFVMSLHSEAFTVIVSKHSKLEKLEDLLGKRINIGSEGSGTKGTWNELMKIKGWTKDSFAKLSELKFLEQPSALCQGDVDALILATGHPTDLVTEVAKLCEIRIIELKDDDINRLVAANPEFSMTIIPGGLYSGVPNAVSTFGVKATLLTTNDVSDDLVYKLTKQVFTNLSSLRASNPMLSGLEIKKMISEGRTAPYHPGALRYYREMGWISTAQQ